VYEEFSSTNQFNKRLGSGKKRKGPKAGEPSNRTLELYKSFMHSYVKRINDSTFKVTIGGIRIGNAKYSRLAQINLKSRIITFSRFAIENVPERGRRYLVLHELAHVLEASHNKRFWNLVEFHEPEYHEIGLTLDKAFKKNVQKHERGLGGESSRLVSDASTIWTPDHGFVELGNAKLGLNRDPLKSFNLSVNLRYSDEAYNEYLELRESHETDASHYSEHQVPHANLIYTASMSKPASGLLHEADHQADCEVDCFSEDEGYMDDFFGTMSGGDD
jgi:hypothetical protein